MKKVSLWLAIMIHILGELIILIKSSGLIV
jgi:hypothetical protein